MVIVLLKEHVLKKGRIDKPKILLPVWAKYRTGIGYNARRHRHFSTYFAGSV
jgi:hypothetical protein